MLIIARYICNHQRREHRFQVSTGTTVGTFKRRRDVRDRLGLKPWQVICEIGGAWAGDSITLRDGMILFFRDLSTPQKEPAK